MSLNFDALGFSNLDTPSDRWGVGLVPQGIPPTPKLDEVKDHVHPEAVAFALQRRKALWEAYERAVEVREESAVKPSRTR